MEGRIKSIVEWLRTIFDNERKAVIGISGGVDSALALTLLVKAIGKERIIPVLLPYGEQDMGDARLIVEWNGLTNQAKEINIAETVDMITDKLGVEGDQLRKGNIMSRVRMIIIFDMAKKLGALVCGTENKSEHYLGYFTRFGDAASDVEPVSSLYKTGVWEMAREIGLPEVFVTKAPSAGLWQGQTDEEELGFTYREADKVLRLLIDEKKTMEQAREVLDQELVERVVSVVQKNGFKLRVPYELKT